MAHTYGPMNIYPNSNAHLGDIYNVNTNDPDPRLGRNKLVTQEKADLVQHFASSFTMMVWEIKLGS